MPKKNIHGRVSSLSKSAAEKYEKFTKAQQAILNKMGGVNFEKKGTEKLTDIGLNINDRGTREIEAKSGRMTEKDRVLFAFDDSDYAILEFKSGRFKSSTLKGVDQLNRLTSLAEQKGMYLIIVTPDGTMDKFNPRMQKAINNSVKESGNPIFLVSGENPDIAEDVDIEGVTYGFPKDIMINGNNDFRDTIGDLVPTVISYIWEAIVGTPQERNNRENLDDVDEPEPDEPDEAYYEPEPDEPDEAYYEPEPDEPDEAYYEPEPDEPDEAYYEPEPDEPESGFYSA